MAADYSANQRRLSHPAIEGEAVTPSDTVGFTYNARSLYVGTGGTVVLLTLGGTALTFVNVPSGSILPIQCSRVNSTGTTASNIVALF